MFITSTSYSEALPPPSMLRDEPDSNEATQDVGALVGAQVAIAQQAIAQQANMGGANGIVANTIIIIQDSHRGPSCENAAIFTGRVTSIIKIHADMRHASWSHVPEEEKQELINRVKREAAPNSVTFYKTTHWSNKKVKCIDATTEHNYNLMLERLAEKETEEDGDEAVDDAFKEVLGFRSGNAIGMGNMVIPEPLPMMKKNEAFLRLSEENQRSKSDVEMYKSKVDQMMADIEALKKGFFVHESYINSRVSEVEGGSESHKETQRDA